MIKKLITTLSVCLIISFFSVSNAVSPGEGGGAGGTSYKFNRNILIYIEQPSFDHIGPIYLFNLNRFLFISTDQLDQTEMITLPDGSSVETDLIRRLVDEKLANSPSLVLIFIPLDRKHLK